MVSGTENPAVVIKKFNFLENESAKTGSLFGLPKESIELLEVSPFALYSSGNTQATAKFAYPTAMKSNTHNP